MENYIKVKLKNINTNNPLIFIIAFMLFMIFSINKIESKEVGAVNNGVVTLEENKLISLDGKWEFYWDELLTQEDFNQKNKPKISSFIKVPGSWSDKGAGDRIYPGKGVGTYRLSLSYPSSIKDPALSIKTVSSAYKLYVNGQLITEVGQVSKKISEFKGDYIQQIVALPRDEETLDIIFQVSNLDYIRGGLRDSVIFGSKELLLQKKTYLLAIQLLFIGAIFAISLYYLTLFFLQKRNKTALIFSIICFVTALRASVWGEIPIRIFFPELSVNLGIFINYIILYNVMPLMVLFIISIYPSEYKKKVLYLVLLPTIFFELLMFAPSGVRASFNNLNIILTFIQMGYILMILTKAVLYKWENAKVLLIAVGFFILSLIVDILYIKGISKIDISYMFLYGNFIVIIAMAFIQAKKEASNYRKLVLYNEKLIEVDKLRDKVLATEIAFLRAQIKPHFLYNALSAIANVCEKDGNKASKLIVNLAIYLRGSLQFNNMDEMITIEKELELINTYFDIEEARFGQKIQLSKEIEIPLDYKIPVLILQPLVENAIRHGISKKIGGGRVTIKIKEISKEIIIEVEDNGVGINKEKLESLFDEKRKSESIGLINIQNRLLRLYGKGMKVISDVGVGTSIKIIIPKDGKKL